METFQQDSAYIITKANIEPLVPYLNERQHVSKGNTTENLTHQLFSMLSRHLIEDLYQHYLIDFEMFDYDYRSYFDLATSD